MIQIEELGALSNSVFVQASRHPLGWPYPAGWMDWLVLLTVSNAAYTMSNESPLSR